MEKQQLIEYLNAVCDAESAAQSCRENIAEIQRQRSMVRSISEPSKPYYRVASVIEGKSPGVVFFNAIILGVYINAPLAVLLTAIYFTITQDYGSPLGALIVFFIIVCMINFFLQMTEETSEKEKMQNAEDARVKEANRKAKENYELALYTYQKSDEVRNNLLSAFDQAIKEQNAILAGVTQRLERLYGMNVLHTSCRDIIAAYQIRQYLEMGICDTLEGPNGAYKQYQFDVLAQRICTSIDDMKKAVVSSIHSMQNVLAGELRLISQSVQDMGTMLHADFQAINTTIGIEQAKNRAQIDAGFQQANAHLSSVEKNLSIAVHNDYIQKRITNVDTYLLKAPDGIW